MTDKGRGRTMVGESTGIRRVMGLIERFGPSDLPVLIEGPTGSGKELIAHALHRASGRSGAFVAFNVCAIPESIFEATLFGYVKGAFTGAMTDNPGYLAEANGGTLFLDEIGGLLPELQVKLLRAIETGEYRPVGARTDRQSDFRVIAAANQPLDDLVRSGRFRHDLAYRLRVAAIRVPPLRDRLDDVPALAAHFVGSYNADVMICESALDVLQGFDWPGNVRELRNVVESALVLRASSDRLSATDIALALQQSRPFDPIEVPEDAERQELLETLRACDWNRSLAARRLGVDRSTIWRRIRRLRLIPDKTAKQPTGPLQSMASTGWCTAMRNGASETRNSNA